MRLGLMQNTGFWVENVGFAADFEHATGRRNEKETDLTCPTQIRNGSFSESFPCYTNQDTSLKSPNFRASVF